MKITYKSEYTSKDRKFSVGRINMLSGYGLQITQPRPVLAEGKLAPGERCVVVFGISKEEYEMKDTDQKALSELADKLLKNVPGDRILMTVVVDLTGKNVEKTVRLKTGESIDGGSFIKNYRLQAGPIDTQLLAARKIQPAGSAKDATAEVRTEWENTRKAVADALLTMETLYTVDDAIFQGRYPYVRDGFIELFTTRERMEKASSFTQRLNMGEDAFKLREITKDEFPTFIERCIEMGLRTIKVDPYTMDILIMIGDLNTREAPRNAALRGLMLQETACGVSYQKLKDQELPEPDRRRLLERMLTLQNFTRREIGNSILWAVCVTTGSVKGKICTKDAKEKLDNAPGLVIAPMVNCVLMGDKQSDAKFLPVFTSEIAAVSFAEKVDGMSRPLAMTFDDIKLLTEKTAAVKGIVLDIEGIGLRILQDQFKAVVDLRDKPRQIVRIQPPKPQTTAAEPVNVPVAMPKPEVRAVPTQDNSLPDPDAFDFPVQEKKTEEDVPACNDESQHPQGDSPEKPNGFFRRLFGKGKK